MLALPSQPQDENVRALAMITRERFTGLTTVTITLQNAPMQTIANTSLETVVKNGLALDPGSQYSIVGKVITLAVAAIAGDVFLVSYHYRS